MSKAIVYRSGQLYKEEIEESGSPNSLRVLQTGVCGSDRHILAQRLGDGPFVIGHEVVGIVDKLDHPELLLGDSVQLGDRVIVAPGINCGKCRNCIMKRKYCSNRFVYGFTPFASPERNGSFAETMELRAGTKLFKVPDAMSDDQASFAEIMACAVGAIEKITDAANLSDLGKVVVLGAGPAGLCVYTAAKFYGMDVHLYDINHEALAFAQRIGSLQIVESLEGLEGVSAVIDCAGSAPAFTQAVELVDIGGIVIEFGAFVPAAAPASFPFWLICQKDLTIRGISETYDRNFPVALRILQESPIQLEQLFTERIPLDELDRIVQCLEKPSIGKAVVVSNLR